MIAMFETTATVCSGILLLTTANVLSQALPPTTKTKLEYYTSGVDWNAANDHCISTGSRLLQYDNSRINDYSKYLTQTLLQLSSTTQLSAWIGMVMKDKGNDTFVWTDGCVEVCYNGWSTYQPGSLNDNFCVSLFFSQPSVNANTSHWLMAKWINIRCDSNRPGFICEYNTGQPCDYSLNFDKTLLIPNADAESELLPGITEAACQDKCDTSIKSNMECWGFSYTSTSSACELFYTIGPFDLGDSMFDSMDTISKIRSCFELVWKPDNNRGTSGTNHVPNTQCFEDLAMTECHTSNTSDEYSSTTKVRQIQSTLADGTVKTSRGSSQLLSSLTSEITTTTTGVTTTRGVSSSLLYQTGIQLESSSLTIPTTDRTSLPNALKDEKTTPIAKTDFSQPSVAPSKTTTKTTSKSSHGIGLETTTSFASREISKELTPGMSTDLREPPGTSSPMTEANTTSTTPKTDCVCWCVAPKIKENVTKEVFIRQLMDDLEINKQNLSSSLRKKVSIYERRTVSVALGSTWIGILVGIYGAVFVSDVIIGGIMSRSKEKVKKSRKTKLNLET